MEQSVFSSSDSEAKVIGIYGIPGSGKSFLLKQLENHLRPEGFDFYEGSEMIDKVTPGGIAAFKELQNQDKAARRAQAIDLIKEQCTENGLIGIVTGHSMFWSEEQTIGDSIYTQNDLDTFTHILFLNVSAEELQRRRSNDPERKDRGYMSTEHLRKWQQAEISQLRHLCLTHGIIFLPLPEHPKLFERVLRCLRDFKSQNEQSNTWKAQSRLKSFLMHELAQSSLETVLVIDADKTLAEEDSGSLLQMKFSERGNGVDLLKDVFSSPMGYTYRAFRQATMLYEEMADDDEFETLCKALSWRVRMYPQFVRLFNLAKSRKHVGILVLTCGVGRVWKYVLDKERLLGQVILIGGDRVRDGFVVTPTVKAALVEQLRDDYKLHVIAFGDSPLDLAMLHKAHEAIVVVGNEKSRSQTMDAALTVEVEKNGLQARQALMTDAASPRLDTKRLPLVQLLDQGFIDSVLGRRKPDFGFQVVETTNNAAAKMLMTSMRDAAASGTRLREIHHKVGWYLAVEYLPNLIGMEECSIGHVQGGQATGYRIRDAQQILVVALMRGGEPMAFGVNDAIPGAAFMHAKDSEDLDRRHVASQHTIVLVDSVVNSGETVEKFVGRVRDLRDSIDIVVITGVVQKETLSRWVQRKEAAFRLVALRVSENRYTGTGTTDTGNRLFNTTYLD